ncbi:hypothetical protein BZA70DRAFT_282974 [Myxozyma melibiosi]|uniref:Uncharacterized protein n=1 Tax=Myxozyma melibiosi TaxID=54550 RepID=A0ABR1F1D7_9ASCO
MNHTNNPSPPPRRATVPIPIPIPISSSLSSATISASQVHRRRASFTGDHDPRSPPALSALAGGMSPSQFYGRSPEQHSPAGFSQFHHHPHPPFAANYSLTTASSTFAPSSSLNHPAPDAFSRKSPEFPPSPTLSASPRSSFSSPSQPEPQNHIVSCDHHHHRRQSVAVSFSPEAENAPCFERGNCMILEQGPSPGRRLSGRFARPPSPTGERILQGEFSF